ncbi:MAG: hypothetical protein C4562_01060, partial [Actinobacteria bacterium]
LGDAQSGDVRAGKTFSNASGNDNVGTLVDRGNGLSITPGTAIITIPAGIYNTDGGVAGDPDLVSANIKAGANIFGVAGKTEVVDTTEGVAPAAVANILSGKKAFVNGALVTGNMTDRGAQVITPGTGNITIPAGYHNGAGYVVGDPDLIAANIKSGANIFGAAGSVIPGAAIASIQRGTLSTGAYETDKDVAISTVDLTKALAFYSVKTSPEYTHNGDAYTEYQLYFTSTTNLHFRRTASDGSNWVYVSWEVIRFNGPINTQQFYGAISGQQITDIAISAVNISKAFIILQPVQGAYDANYREVKATFLDSTTVRLETGGTSGSVNYKYALWVVEIV